MNNIFRDICLTLPGHRGNLHLLRTAVRAKHPDGVKRWQRDMLIHSTSTRNSRTLRISSLHNSYRLRILRHPLEHACVLRPIRGIASFTPTTHFSTKNTMALTVESKLKVSSARTSGRPPQNTSDGQNTD